jgi:hypothetical protein
MFESIVLRRSESGAPISAGQVCEALLFYQRIHLIFDRGTLIQLAKQIGPTSLLSLLQRHEVSAVYCEDMLATITNSVGSQQVHSFAGFTMVGHETTKTFSTSTEATQHTLERAGFARAESKSFARQFHKIVPIRKLSGEFFLKGGITSAAQEDLKNGAFLTKAIDEVLRTTPGVPEVNRPLKFETWHTELGFYVLTNIDFKAINDWRANAIPKYDPITAANLLSSILDARADLALASFYGGDFTTSSAASSVIKIRHTELLQRTGINTENLKKFHEVTFPDCPTLREVIDSNERSFEDFLRLLDKSNRFKNWMTGISPDEGLIRSYLRDVTAAGWAGKLPTKSLRYAFTTGIGAIDPIVGTLISAADSFLVDKIIKGWQPNHFIDNRLSPFLRK